MVTLAELQQRVTARYARLGLPSWPNPHPETGLGSEEEYSRVTDPGRYRIVHARARVWASVLEEALDVRTETLAPGSITRDERTEPYTGGIRLIPRQPGTLPLVLLEHHAPSGTREESLPVLLLGVVEPEVRCEDYPDCACDACDTGSADLLEAIDDSIGEVVGGPYVILRGPNWRAYWYPDGGGAGGALPMSNLKDLQSLCRRFGEGEEVQLPEDCETYIGRSWLT